MRKRGGGNLYAFVHNRPIDSFDILGHSDTSIHGAARNPGALREFAQQYLREIECEIARQQIQRNLIKKAVIALRKTPNAARSALARALGPGTGAAHHIAPLQVRILPIAQKAAKAGFNWNARGNGIRLPSWFHKGYNKWHRGYNKGWKDMLKDLDKANPNMTNEQAARLMQRLTDILKKQLKDVVESGVLP